jgi:predicted enzyme related to lactoylglutathione lyase
MLARAGAGPLFRVGGRRYRDRIELAKMGEVMTETSEKATSETTAEAVPKTYPQGVSCWIDTEQADTEAATRFYGGLFGWTFSNAMPADAPGVYLIAQLDGEDAAAIGSTEDRDAAASWSTYIAVDDADATAAAIEAAGGTVVVAPADAGPAGRVAACADPQGAEFRIWQAGERLGAQAVNGPSAWSFSDLHTTDPDAAKRFYSTVFGWEYHDFGATVEAMIAVPGYGEHLASTNDPDIYERQVGAPPGFADVIGAIEHTAEGEAPRWTVKFGVVDRAASVEKVQQLGGTLLGTDDQVWALLAHVRDPQGAELTLSEYHPRDESGEVATG